MDKYKIELGSTIRKYRNAKKYSTQELAKLLGVSVGRINHLENDKNDIFKIPLLMQLVKTLDIPFEEIFSQKIIKVDSIEHDSKKIKVMFEYEGIENAQELVREIKELIKGYLECASLYKFDTEAMSIISSHLLHEMELSKKIKNLEVL